MSVYLPEALRQPFKGILFDLDGTLIDSEELHYAAWKQALLDFGYDMESIGEPIPYQGNFRKMYTEIAGKLRLPEDLFEEVYQHKMEITLATPATAISVVDGVISFLELLKEQQVPLGIVTNSEQAYVDHVLDGFGFRDYFDQVVHADHVVQAKPAPDGYNYGVSLLDLSSQDVLAFENTDTGIAAAVGAGLKVIAIRSTDWLGQSTYAAAHFVVDNFADSALDDLQFVGRQS